jgi:hypothetical protein
MEMLATPTIKTAARIGFIATVGPESKMYGIVSSSPDD